MRLSILIPSLPDRDSQNYLRRLVNILQPQINHRSNEVELVINNEPRNIPTGTKRNMLIDKSTGEYFCMIDCDDLVPIYYVDEMLQAISSNPDVVTFKGYMTTGGLNRVNFIIKLGEKYEERQGMYFRWPNHLCAFRKELVHHVKFEPIWQQEDYKWSKRINDMKLLKSEIHINKDLYHYDFKVKTPTHGSVVSRRSRLR